MLRRFPRPDASGRRKRGPGVSVRTPQNPLHSFASFSPPWAAGLALSACAFPLRFLRRFLPVSACHRVRWQYRRIFRLRYRFHASVCFAVVPVSSGICSASVPASLAGELGSPAGRAAVGFLRLFSARARAVAFWQVAVSAVFRRIHHRLRASCLSGLLPAGEGSAPRSRPRLSALPCLVSFPFG